MKKINGILNLVLLLVVIGGCQKTSQGGTSTGNPLISLKITGSSSAATVAFHRPLMLSPWFLEIFKPALALPAPSLSDSSGATVVLSEAWMVVREIEFKAEETATDTEVDGAEVSFEGPFVIDLLAANPDSLGQANISTASVRRIKMQLHNADTLPSGAPNGLLNKSLYWKGTVSGHDFTFTSSEGYEYEVSGPNGVSLTDNSNVLLSIKVADLFKKIDLSAISATTDINQNNKVSATNPCPLIDASAADLYTCFTKGLKSEADLGKDSNGDDELDSGDDSVK